MNLFKKIILKIKKPKVIIVTEDDKSIIRSVFSIINSHFKVRILEGRLSVLDLISGEVILINSSLEDLKLYDFLLENSQKSVLLFAGINQEYYKGNFKDLSGFDLLLFNSDSVNISNFEKEEFSEVYGFGFNKKSDFQATDMKINSNTNFKLNYQGSIIPFWLEGRKEKKDVYSVLAGSSLGKILGLNLVSISEEMKGINIDK